jgi:hypothetical protein
MVESRETGADLLLKLPLYVIIVTMTVTDSNKGLMFKALANKSLFEVGVEFGFDKHFKDSKGVKNAVYRIYNEVRQDPKKYLLTQEVVDMVVGIVSNRGGGAAANSPSLKEKNDALANRDFKELVLSNRNQAMGLLEKKMQRVGRNKKSLDEVSITSLATVFGVLFDKAQIVQGQSTENIAMIAKVDKDLSPDQAMELILKSREQIVESKEDKAE